MVNNEIKQLLMLFCKEKGIAESRLEGRDFEEGNEENWLMWMDGFRGLEWRDAVLEVKNQEEFDLDGRGVMRYNIETGKRSIILKAGVHGDQLKEILDWNRANIKMWINHKIKLYEREQ